MDEFDSLQAEFTRLRSKGSKKDLQAENERLREVLESSKEIIECLRMQKVSLEKDAESARRSNESTREENTSLRRIRDELQMKSDLLKRELKFIRAAFRMGGLRYSCRAVDKQDSGTISVSAFRSIVMKSNVNLSDEEVEIIVRKAMSHGDGQIIHYEAFFNSLTEM